MESSPLHPALPRAAIAFNVFNAETILGVAAAVAETGWPAFMQTSASTVRSYGAAALGGMIRALVPASVRPHIVLHLDHCDSDAMFRDCLEAGWDSIMVDASARPLEENIRRTGAVAAMANARGVFAEGEIGVVGGDEDGWESYAGGGVRPALAEVLRFIDESGAHLIAVGVGTKHGHYDDPCQVDQPLLEAIHAARPDTALVLHGGSGIPEDQLRAAVQRGGVRKLNISTDIKDAWLDAQRRHLASADPHKVVAGVEGAVAAVKSVALSKMNLLASFLT
jgi:ketose-bisphosphate aldolase